MWSLLEFRIAGSTSDPFNEKLQLGPPVIPMKLGSEKYRSVRCQQRPAHPDTCWYLRRLHPLFSNTLYSMPVFPAHLSPPLPSLWTHGTHGAFYPGYPSPAGCQLQCPPCMEVRLKSSRSSHLQPTSGPIASPPSPVPACLLDGSGCWNLSLPFRRASVSFRASLVAQLVKNLPAMQETPVRFLGWENPQEKG